MMRHHRRSPYRCRRLLLQPLHNPRQLLLLPVPILLYLAEPPGNGAHFPYAPLNLHLVQPVSASYWAWVLFPTIPATMTMMEETLLLQNMNLAELHALASFSGLHIPLSLRVSPRALPLKKKGSRFRRLNLLLFIKVKTRIIRKIIKINTWQVKSKDGR
jgi:hypothetical protein